MSVRAVCAVMIAGAVAACGSPTPRSPIQVEEASFGLNCSATQKGNATDPVKQECGGEMSCSFAVDHAASPIADPCPGQPKDFAVSYRCGEKRKAVNVTSAKGKLVILSCGR